MKITEKKLFIPMTVLWVCIAFSGSSFAVEKVPDGIIAANVTDALGDDARINFADIRVSSDKGIVTLSGSIGSLAGKNYADMETKKINGVIGVVNQIKITPDWQSDADIRNAVRRRILNSAVIKSEGIKVACSKGVVTLSGTVGAWNESEEAKLLASEVHGVAKVVSKVWVKWAEKRSDKEIQDDAVAKLARDVYLESLPITVAVENGVATLKGSVGSAFEKDLAREDVRGVANVKKVKNRLEVVYWENYGTREKKTTATNSGLKDAVREELAADLRVDDSDIAVKVDYGSVTLSGTVYSHGEKRIAEQDAKNVIGVAWVSNKLFARVDKRADWAVRDDVQFNIDTDATTEGFNIDVAVNNSVVTLSGTVNSWYEKSHAESVASRVKGVQDVINQIVEGDTQPANSRAHSAALVAKAIKKSLEANAATKWVSDDINVSVKDGVATLSGKVDTWHQRAEAADTTFTTKGVWEVKNLLEVDGFDYDWEVYGTYIPFYYW